MWSVPVVVYGLYVIHCLEAISQTIDGMFKTTYFPVSVVYDFNCKKSTLVSG